MKYTNNLIRKSNIVTVFRNRRVSIAQPLAATLTRQELSLLVAQMVD